MALALRLRLLAAPALCVEEGLPQLLPANDALLLALLTIDGAMPRDALARWLWPDNPSASARANLRQRVKRLQDSTQGELLSLHGTQLALGAQVGHDLADMPAALQADPQAASGALLGTFEFPSNAAASEWLARARSRVQAQRQQVLSSRAEVLEQSRRLQDALPYAQRLVDESPLLEHAHRRLMGLHYQRGDRGAALAVYRRLADTLRQQVGSAPDAQTQALAQLIERGTPPATVTGASPPTSDKGSAPRAPSAQAAATGAALMRPPRLLQRQSEWNELNRNWQRGGVTLVLGQAGIGKSRLLHDFADSAGISLRLQARPGDAAVPFSLLARWVGERQPQALALPSWARSELARLTPALGQPAPGPLSILHLTQALALLNAEQESVLLDDLHFADIASLELLPSTLQPMRCSLLASRTAELPQSLQAWLDQAGHDVTRLQLQPWHEATVHELLLDVAVPVCETRIWAPLLWRHTGGHPLLVLETLRAVLLALPDGETLGAPPSSLPTPPQVLQLVRQRLDTLSAGALQVAQVACLAGSAFSPELSAMALARPLAELGAPWQELQDVGLMSAQGVLHDLVLEAVRATLTTPGAMALHAIIARHLQANGAPPASVAAHWAAAGERALAASSHEAAAGVAARLSRRNEQIAHWAEAARCWQQAGNGDRAFRASAEEADQLIVGGDVACGLERAQDLVGMASTPHQRAQAHRLRALALLYGANFERGLEASTLAHAEAKVTGDSQLIADVVVLRSWAAAALNQTALADECLAEDQRLPFEGTDWQRAISRRSVTCMALQRLGRVEAALAENERCIEWADRPEARSAQMILLSNSAAMLNLLARQGQAHERATQALRLAQALGEDSSMTGANARMHVGLLACSLGKYDEAIIELERCLADIAKLQLPRLVATAQNHLAWLWTVLGQPERALRMLESDTTELTLVHRLRRWTIRAEMHRLCGTRPPGPPPADAGQCPDLSVNGSAHLILARELPSEARLVRLEELERHFEDHSMPGQALLARVLQLRPLTSLQPQAACSLAMQVQQRLQQSMPNTCHWPEAMWEVHLALRGGDSPALAQQALAQAWRWIERAHSHQVPQPFKTSFLQRNLINAAIQRAWATASAP
ncbi:putative Transcriptional activator [Rubrivivax sp. A210]|uniref:BTAD domain-containing putative transcriptional regulator n=1 Tax=Rubrivivax sp. A210 TaxID=2772301 RepID=UPI00191AEB64|nr:BTAD domain-containing putative transcriptional regulator [Rubrivivax sp. A210]CAD5370617.1 putative Transcriptional activator [Rubrivivax sp. A210]